MNGQQIDERMFYTFSNQENPFSLYHVIPLFFPDTFFYSKVFFVQN